MISEQDEPLHHADGVSRHGEHFGHQVAVALEEGHRAKLDVQKEGRHSCKRLQVLLALVRCGSD